MKKIIKLFLIFSYSFIAFGVETITHSNCNMYNFKSDLLTKSEKKILTNSLKEKGYTIKEIPTNKKLDFKSFYYEVKKKRFGKLYKSCLVELEIKTNSDSFIKDTDESIYKNSSTRKFPRHTFQGSERCEMALNDLLFSVNFCKKGN